ncbi:MAG: protein phosphatase 2C domain-containing protein [Elusimicrobiota bacterium]
MVIDFAAVCDVGPVRSENQDRYVVSDFAITFTATQSSKLRIGEQSDEVLLAVADGMGGVAGGAQAAEVALETIAADYIEYADTRSTQDALSGAIEAAHHAVRDRADEQGLTGMGTTATVVLLRGDMLYLAHVGDSRAYLYRGRELVRLTTDHGYWSKLRGYDGDDVRNLAGGNVLAQCVGGIAESVLVEVSQVELCRGDRLLLCSDGLHGVVDQDDIRRRMAGGGPSWTAGALHMAALAAATQDNVTAVVAHLIDEELPEAAEGETIRLEPVVEVVYDKKTHNLVRRIVSGVD